MALADKAVFEIQTGGNDSNGGGFISGASGTDYSTSATKRSGTGTDDSTTDAVANGTTTITSATANFQSSIVGNIICLSGGTGSLTKNWYQVTSRTNATTIVVDRTVATGTGITMNVGGALASIGMVGNIIANIGAFAGTIYVWVKAGTYTITSASTNVANGCVNANGFTTAWFEGYNSTRGDLGTKPLIQADGVITTFTFISQGANGFQYIRNMKFDGNSRTSSRGLSIRGEVYDCQFVNFTNGAVVDNIGTAVIYNCSATGCSTQPVFQTSAVNCVAYDNTVTAFNNGTFDTFFVRCIADSNSGASSDGFASSASSEKVRAFNCIAYNNGRNGFSFQGTRGNLAVNCIAESNGGTGFLHTSNNQNNWYNCAAYNNTTANFTVGTNLGSWNLSSVTGSGGSFFVDAANQDFSLNNTASRGAAARAAGSPGTILDLGTPVGYLDIGVYQHQDPASSSGGGSFTFC